MKFFKERRLAVLLITLSWLAPSCEQQTNDYENTVRVRIARFPDSYNPVNYTSSQARLILNRLYQFPQEIDMVSSDPLNSAAELIEIIPDGDRLRFKFHIREQAIWSSGAKITTDDIETSLKIYNLPGINNQQSRLLYSLIEEYRIGENKAYFELIATGSPEFLRPRIAGFFILPKHLFDPAGMLDRLSLEQIKKNPEKVLQDSSIQQFIVWFESDDFNKSLIEGGNGPYKISEWNLGHSITLTKNSNWWGQDLAIEDEHLKNFPDQLKYEVISDESVAVIALKNEVIDIMSGVPPGDFTSMSQSSEYQSMFHFLSPVSYQFFYWSQSLVKTMHF